MASSNSATKVTRRQAFANSLSTSNLIAISILIAIVSVVLALILGRMLVNNLMLNSRVISKKTAASRQINANYDALKGLQDEYNSLGATRDKIAAALPNRPSLPELWSMFENIGNESGVTTTSLSTTATEDVEAPAGGEAQSLNVVLSVRGSYDAVQKYLKNLEISSRPVRVTNVTLSGTSSVIQASLNATTYYQGPADLTVGSEVVQ